MADIHNRFLKSGGPALGKLGSGVITGASRNDPSSITTYAMAGSRVGYSLLWTLIISLPFLAGIQDISARVSHDRAPQFH